MKFRYKITLFEGELAVQFSVLGFCLWFLKSNKIEACQTKKIVNIFGWKNITTNILCFKSREKLL